MTDGPGMGVPFLCPAAGHTFRYPVGITPCAEWKLLFELRYFRALVKELNVSSHS